MRHLFNTRLARDNSAFCGGYQEIEGFKKLPLEGIALSVLNIHRTCFLDAGHSSIRSSGSLGYLLESILSAGPVVLTKGTESQGLPPTA